MLGKGCGLKEEHMLRGSSEKASEMKSVVKDVGELLPSGGEGFTG